MSGSEWILVMQYTDRAVTPDDAALIIALHNAPHAAPHVHAPNAERAREAIADERIEQRIIVDRIGDPMGLWVAFRHDDGWLVELARIIVAQPRQGVGRWALRRATSWAFEVAGATAFTWRSRRTICPRGSSMSQRVSCWRGCSETATGSDQGAIKTFVRTDSSSTNGL